MPKQQIDKLDLRKKVEAERPVQKQVHVRIGEQNLRRQETEEYRETEEAQDWQDIKQAEEELGPGEVAPSRSILNSFQEKISKITKSSAVVKTGRRDDYRDEEPRREIRMEEPRREVLVKTHHQEEPMAAEHLKRAVAIRSAMPKPVEEEPEDEPETETLNLKHKKILAGHRPIQEIAVKSFQDRIAEKTSKRVQIEREEIQTVDQVEEVSMEEVCPTATSSYKRSVLSNGLKLITAPIGGTKTVTALIMYGTGAKYESLSVNGLSHFLEHMFFKGTKRRPNAQKLSSDLDALGCEYNAFTSKEYTGYWIKVDSSKIAIGLDILSDMLLNSEFSTKEINKERGVIIEEINMYHENPMMYIEDVFESCLYGDTPAGREIAGPKSNINAFKRQNFLNYFSSQYGANSAVLCLAGNIDEKTERLAEKFFGKMPRAAFKEKIRTPDAQRVPSVKIHYKEGNQAVLSLGVRAYDAYHEDKIIVKLLSIILGGSMSSRMFTEVREKRGLAYSVHTTSESYTDTGYLTTQAGIPVGKQEEVIKVILAEYKKIRTKLVSAEELKRAKDLIKGRTIIGFEASDNVANWYAQRAVLKENLSTPEEFFARLAKIKAEDIRRVASDIFRNDKLNLAIIGPFQREEEFENLLKL
jgi:predicted Zn-dependent peptidase